VTKPTVEPSSLQNVKSNKSNCPDHLSYEYILPQKNTYYQNYFPVNDIKFLRVNLQSKFRFVSLKEFTLKKPFVECMIGIFYLSAMDVKYPDNIYHLFFGEIISKSHLFFLI